MAASGPEADIATCQINFCFAPESRQTLAFFRPRLHCLRLNGTPAHTVQCRSRLVSGTCLPKTGISRVFARDFRGFLSQIV
jgi:hypothetical protein